MSSCLTSVFIAQSLCRVLPIYLNSVTCGSWADCFLTLPNGVPFRNMYSVFSVDTFIPLFSMASLHCSSSNSSMSFSLAHSTTSSANIICQGDSFLMFSVSEIVRSGAEIVRLVVAINDRCTINRVCRRPMVRSIDRCILRPIVRAIMASCDRSYEHSWHPVTECTINRGTRRQMVRSIVGCNDRSHDQS